MMIKKLSLGHKVPFLSIEIRSKRVGIIKDKCVSWAKKKLCFLIFICKKCSLKQLKSDLWYSNLKRQE